MMASSAAALVLRVLAALALLASSGALVLPASPFAALCTSGARNALSVLRLASACGTYSASSSRSGNGNGSVNGNGNSKNSCSKGAVYELRTTLRRMLSLAAVAGAVGEPAPRQPLRLLKRTLSALGRPRDSDVARELLASLCLVFAESGNCTSNAYATAVCAALRRRIAFERRREVTRLVEIFAGNLQDATSQMHAFFEACGNGLASVAGGAAGTGGAVAAAAAAATDRRAALSFGFGAFLLRSVDALRTHFAKASAELTAAAEAGSAPDIESLHEARILCKELRYALEPLVSASGSPGGATEAAHLVGALQQLQTSLGTVHDFENLGRRILDEPRVKQAAASSRLLMRPQSQPLLEELAMLARAHEAAATASFAAEWLSPETAAAAAVTAAAAAGNRSSGCGVGLGGATAATNRSCFGTTEMGGRVGSGDCGCGGGSLDLLLVRAGAYIRGLATTALCGGVEVERRWLLRSLPPVLVAWRGGLGSEELEHARVFQMDMAYLKGTSVLERLRRIHECVDVGAAAGVEAPPLCRAYDCAGWRRKSAVALAVAVGADGEVMSEQGPPQGCHCTVRMLRTFKSGSGLARQEAEEEVPAPDAAFFEALWSASTLLLRKTRFRVPVAVAESGGGSAWEVDVVEGGAHKGLVLLELELPSPTSAVPPFPAWLRDFVGDEVTESLSSAALAEERRGA